jgi:hypothetical protein
MFIGDRAIAFIMLILFLFGRKGYAMFIGAGAIAFIVLILFLFWIF